MPSTRTLVGFKRRPLTARCMASIVACRMLSWSISSTDGQRNRTTQRFGTDFVVQVLTLGQRSAPWSPPDPLIGARSSRITAAATTGPASGPRPASSTPATSPGTSQASLACSAFKNFFDRIGGQLGGVALQGVVHRFKAKLQSSDSLRRIQPFEHGPAPKPAAWQRPGATRAPQTHRSGCWASPPKAAVACASSCATTKDACCKRSPWGA